MEKRAVLAVVISLIILVAYQEVAVRYWFPHQQPGDIQEVTAPPAEPPPPPVASVPEMAPAFPAPIAVAEGRRVVVETGLYRASFTTAGARLESLQLKEYRTTVDPASPLQEMVVSAHGGELPFAVELRGAKVVSDAGAAYAADATALTASGGESKTVEFVWQGDSGTIRKRFTFYGDRYAFDAAVSARGVPADLTELAIGWARAIETPVVPGADVLFDRTAFVEGRKLTEDPFEKLADGKVLNGNIVWAGFAGRHFLAAMVPPENQNLRLWLKSRGEIVEEKLLFPLVASTEVKLDIYIGPKDFDVLNSVGHGLSRAVAFGWSEFIAVPLLHVLKFSHRFTGNYGIDIILLTLLIKVLFIPLTNRSFQSMRAMQKLQPQMAKVREKYKDNAEEMNKEIMELYRRNKVNPLGGCLPMVLQIPVFIGLYSALMSSIELRHAPFVLWINDLSAPDRLGSFQLPFVQHPGIPVLTLLMGASMFAQQWMTPSAGDPAQQRMMMIMPLMFTFMFVNFPAGLVLYWLVNNVLTIAQQYYSTRTAT